LGLPGVLPVLNDKAVRYAVLTGLMLGCEISRFSKFDRKNYFYPDLPKNYQISQYDLPLCRNGYLEIAVDEKMKRVGINRVHLEEDAGKLVHSGTAGGDSGVDYNRTGLPLLEIVSEPEIVSPEEAFEYLKALKQVIRYLGVSDCDMEKGSLRCDANVSIRPKGEARLGVKAEIKNMNSFKAVHKALSYEIERQTEALAAGERIVQETRLWEPESERTHPMRSKEEAHDYRYFPEPDLVPVVMDEATLEEMKAELPEMPLLRKRRFEEQYGIPAYDADVLTAEKEIADFFEKCTDAGADPKAASNIIMGELLRELKQKQVSIADCGVTPEGIAGLLAMVDKGAISFNIAKEVFAGMFGTGKSAEEIVKDRGLTQISDAGEIDEIVSGVINDNPKSVDDYKAGKKKAMGFLVGQVMKASGGKANPRMVNEILRKKLV
jgi:aspartyl-tRNA(Asn)/glutamyl-tRNA(Gln) amidotransferase subunit B